MITVSPQRLNHVCMAGVLMITLACGYGAFGHVRDTKKQIQIEKDVLSEKLKQINMAEANLGDLKAFLEKAGAELAYLNQRVPEPGKIGLLLQQIDALMQQHKINMVSIAPMAVVEENMYTRNPIRFVFEGRFPDIYYLLSDIQQMNRMVVMDRISITKASPTKVCRVDMVTSVFERKKEKSS
jgi:Tfp pilus assembly protein PilO